MLALRFHHVGVGTTDFDEAIRIYGALGHRLYRSVDDPLLNVRVAFLRSRHGDGPWIEILAPLGEGGPLQSLIKRKLLPSPYHTCYAVADVHSASQDLQQLGFLPLGEARPAVAFDQALVAFFHHGALGLVELVQNPPSFRLPEA